MLRTLLVVLSARGLLPAAASAAAAAGGSDARSVDLAVGTACRRDPRAPARPRCGRDLAGMPLRVPQ